MRQRGTSCDESGIDLLIDIYSNLFVTGQIDGVCTIDGTSKAISSKDKFVIQFYLNGDMV